MFESKTIEQLAADAALLSAVAEPIRMQLLEQLTAGPSCVCNLRTQPEIPANLLSYHLKVLREAGLIEGARRGRWIDYALVEGALQRLHAALPGAGVPTRRLTVLR